MVGIAEFVLSHELEVIIILGFAFILKWGLPYIIKRYFVVRKDIDTLKNDVSGLKKDVDAMKIDVVQHKEKIHSIKGSLKMIEMYFQQMK